MEYSIGVLLLSNVGFSFMEDLIGAVRARGVRVYVLSSLPEPPHQRSRPGVLADLADDVRVTAEHVLTREDVEEYLGHLRGMGERALCCLTVWEGYRHLMALANAQLGVPDLDEKQVLELRDKLTLRNRLADAGLSRGRAVELTPQTLREYQRRGVRYFVKPVSGIASFGTFPLGPDTALTDLDRIAAEARADPVYASAFGDSVNFLIEDYVPGREFSFEVMVVCGEPHVVAIHEKVEVTEAAGTVLEDCCVSPPSSLSEEERAAGICWVASVLCLLELRWGCFHIEARHAPSGWDLIEINPRVGGSLISPSVAALTGGPSMLDFWLDSLLTADQPTGFRKVLKELSYATDGSTPSESATFFRVFFAEPGTIRQIGPNDDLPIQPIVSQILLKPGDVVESSSREVFLGQLLWRMDGVDRARILPGLLHWSSNAIEVIYEKRRQAVQPIFLIVDYNLSRIDEVRHMRNYARERYDARVVLVRADPTEADRQISDEVLDLDPLRDDFAEIGAKLLDDRREQIKAGIVFSDDAVHSGAALLERLGVPVDSPHLAEGAFSKYHYRLSEARAATLLAAQRIMVPAFAEIGSLEQLQCFASGHPEGFVVKPAAEGNNRGVVVVRPGDDLTAVFAEVLPYLEGGVICEQLIPYRREYSFDGLGALSFLTEKISASGRYPVEIAQVLPARVAAHERATLERAGQQANWLVGERDGPFHNEIKLSDDGTHAAVVEPNRRPAGMKIWSLARWVYGIDLHHRWVDAAFGAAADLGQLVPGCSAATVMLGVGSDRSFSPDDVAADATPFLDTVHATAERYGLGQGELTIKEFSWLSPERRHLPAAARDNADFAAQGCVVLRGDRVDIRTVVHALREAWLDALDRSVAHPATVRKAL